MIGRPGGGGGLRGRFIKAAVVVFLPPASDSRGLRVWCGRFAKRTQQFTGSGRMSLRPVSCCSCILHQFAIGDINNRERDNVPSLWCGVFVRVFLPSVPCCCRKPESRVLVYGCESACI